MRISPVTISYQPIIKNPNFLNKKTEVSFRANDESRGYKKSVYFTKDTRILSEEEHHKYERDLKKGGEARDKAREQLILSFLPLVCRISQKYIKCVDKGLYSDDDIIQQGIIGMIKSIDKFDIDKGVDFVKFIEYGINSQIIRALKYKNIIRLPRKKRKLFIDAMNVYSELYQTKTEEPTNEEIAKVLKVAVKDIDEVLNAGQKTLSINSVNQNGDELEEFIAAKQKPVYDIVNEKLRKEELRKNLRVELKRLLKPKYYEVLALHYGLEGKDPVNSVETSKLLNTTRANIYLIEKRAFARIKSSGKVKKIFEEYVKNN